MNLSIDLNEEQSDSLNDILLRENSLLSKDSPLFAQESYLEKLILSAVNSYVKTAYENSLRQIGEDASKLPYSTRKSLIAQVKASIPS